MRERVQVLFVVDTLEYLARGGRIGKARALVGNILGIKPILGVVDGEIVPVDRVRGGRAAHPRLIELFRERVDPQRPVIVTIAHAKAPVWGDRLRGLIEKSFEVREILSGEMGPVVVANAAPPWAAFNFFLQLGYGNAATEAVSGQTIIAFQPEERRKAMIDESLALSERRPQVTELNRQLNEIADAGSVISPSHFLVGVIDICAPVLDKSGRAVASLVVPCLQQLDRREDFEGIRKRLVEACAEISAALI